jgi:hypothetical protein
MPPPARPEKGQGHRIYVHFFTRTARFFLSEEERDELVTIMKEADMLDGRPLSKNDYLHGDSLNLYVALANLASYEQGESCGDWRPTQEEADEIRAAADEEYRGPELAACRGIPLAALMGNHCVCANEVLSALIAFDKGKLDVHAAALGAVRSEMAKWANAGYDEAISVGHLVDLWDMWLAFLRTAEASGGIEVVVY